MNQLHLSFPYLLSGHLATNGPISWKTAPSEDLLIAVSSEDMATYSFPVTPGYHKVQLSSEKRFLFICSFKKQLFNTFLPNALF